MATSSRHFFRTLTAALPRLRPHPHPQAPLPPSSWRVAAIFCTAAALTPADVRADLAAAAVAPTPYQPPPIIPLHPSLPPSSHATLLAAVARADLSAIQSLSAVANDVDAHAALIRAGAVPALAAALSVADGGEGKANEALRVNVVRVLADLSRSREAHAAFAEVNVPFLLARLLEQHPPWGGQDGGWMAWVWGGGWLPWTGKKGEGARKQEEDQEVEPAAVGDFMNLHLPGQALPAVDLAAGIAYHTVRCLSNLARNTATHGELLSAGVLPLLVSALSRTDASFADDVSADHERTELVRCTILTVAALAKSAPADVVARGGHRRLVQMAARSQDPVAQMYAAGGVRNLARHPEHEGKNAWAVHRELVVVGAVDALKAGMAAKANAQTQVFSALAFADLMTTHHHKADVIRRWLEPAFEGFAALLVEKNAGVARAVYRALTAMFRAGEKGEGAGVVGTVVPPSLAKAVAEESGQLVNGPVARGEFVALKAVRAMCGNPVVAKGMVDKGLLEILVRGARQGKGEYWEESTAALSLLSAHSEFVELIVSRGALQAVLQRPCLEHNARWASAFVANISRNDEHHVEIAHGSLEVLLMGLTSKDESAKREAARGFYNLSLGGVSRVMIGQSPALTSLVRAAGSSTGETRRFAIGALARISEAYEHATKLIEADLIRILLEAAKEDPKVSRDVAMCISHISQVIGVHGSLASSGAAAWLVDMACRNGGRGEDAPDVMAYSVLGICNIAYSVGITRKILREAGAVSVLTAISSSGMSAPQVTYGARQALHNLRGEEKPGMLPIETGLKPALPA